MIREITIEMLEDLTNLFIESFNAPPWNDEWTVETAGKRIQDFINTPGFYGIAQYENEKLLGMIFGRSEQYFDGVSFQILEFCIDRERQREGIGKGLLNEMIIRLKEQDIKNVFLLTLRGEATEGFYEKNGFIDEKNMLMMSRILR